MRLDEATGAGRIALLHHWDTDGVSSAALVVRALRERGWSGEALFVCPELGAYEIGPELRERIAGLEPDAVFLLDYNVNAADVDALAEACGAPVALIDHHKPRTPEAALDRGRTTVLNPVAGGGGEREYPSTTWVLEQHLGVEPRWLVDMGIVGDLGYRAPDWFGALGEESRRLDSAPWSFDQLYEAGQLVDALYKVNDRAAVEAAATFLATADGLDDVLGNAEWCEIARDVDAEMARLRAVVPQAMDGALVFAADTHMNLASALTRLLAREHEGVPVVVINGTYYEDARQFYVRNLASEVVTSAIATATERGWSAGGKDSVFAAIVPTSDAEAFLDELVGLVEVK